MDFSVHVVDRAVLTAVRVLLLLAAAVVTGPIVGYFAAAALVAVTDAGDSTGLVALAYLGAPAVVAAGLARLLRFRWFALVAALASSASALAVAAYVLSHLNLQL